MISYVKGKLVEKTPTYVVVECNGIGYHINISLNTYDKIGDNESCKFFTEFVVREDAQLLYGFADVAERRLFQLLVSVSGVGPSTALIVLSSGNPFEIQEAIVGSDVAWFKKVKGIGPKTAQRVIIDLKDKVLKENIGADFSAPQDNTIKDEALSALIMLGFNKIKAEKTVSALLKANSELSVEEIVKSALKGA